MKKDNFKDKINIHTYLFYPFILQPPYLTTQLLAVAARQSTISDTKDTLLVRKGSNIIGANLKLI